MAMPPVFFFIVYLFLPRIALAILKSFVPPYKFLFYCSDEQHGYVNWDCTECVNSFQ